MLFKKVDKSGLKNLESPKSFIENLNKMLDVCNNNVSILFDNMIPGIISNKKLNQIVFEIFIKGRKLEISTVSITKLYFKVPKDVTLNSTHHSPS